MPDEQIVADKFGANAAEVSSPLGIPDKAMAISVNLTDPDRVAGFVNPGLRGRDLRDHDGVTAAETDPNAPAQ